MHKSLHNIIWSNSVPFIKVRHRFSFQEMSKNTQISNDVLKIIQEKERKEM